MLIKTSNWSVLYYFFNNLWRQFFSIIIIASSVFSGFNNQTLLILILWLIISRLVKGIFLSRAITIFVDADHIIVNKKILNNKQVKILKNDIQSIKTKESFIGRFLHVVDLDISIKENILENQNIRIKCITVNDKNTILSFMDKTLEENTITSTQEWLISKKQMLLSATMSLSWSYIISFAYLREDLKGISNIPFFNLVFDLFEKIFEQKYEFIAYIELTALGFLIAIITNIFKYNNYRIRIYDGTMFISRGLLDSYKSSIKLSEISSISIRESVFSSLIGGYGKLLAEGQIDEEDTLSLTIFPFEKVEKIKAYVKDWFNINLYQKCIVKKRKAIRVFEFVFTLIFFTFINILLLNKLSLKYYIFCFAISICLIIHILIKINSSYISIDENAMVIFKAGINSKTVYVKNAEVASFEVKNNFIQRKFKCSTLCINYISCNNEYDITFRNYNKKDIEHIIQIWKLANLHA